MALIAYETLTTALLQARSSPTPLVATPTIDSYINIARRQVAADGECVRAQATMTLIAGQPGYNFSSFVVSGSAQGVGSVITVRSGIVGVRALDFRPYEYYAAYYRSIQGFAQPTLVAQQSQGVKGNLFFFPIPDQLYLAVFDAVCLPVDLVDDSTPEVIPQLWTDAVPFYAAWLAMMNLQRQGDAQMMMQRYHDLMRRGRQFATPSELPDNMPGGVGAQMASAHGPLSGAGDPSAPTTGQR